MLNGNKLKAIKAFRALTREKAGLKNSKEAVEEMLGYLPGHALERLLDCCKPPIVV
jgi:ribosomal protein L7/L12